MLAYHKRCFLFYNFLIYNWTTLLHSLTNFLLFFLFEVHVYKQVIFLNSHAFCIIPTLSRGIPSIWTALVKTNKLIYPYMYLFLLITFPLDWLKRIKQQRIGKIGTLDLPYQQQTPLDHTTAEAPLDFTCLIVSLTGLDIIFNLENEKQTSV